MIVESSENYGDDKGNGYKARDSREVEMRISPS